MKTPAAIARAAKIVPSPPTAGTKAAKPIRMSQIESSNIPIFFVKFMPILLSFLINGFITFLSYSKCNIYVPY
jgi:hypothetical protein